MPQFSHLRMGMIILPRASLVALVVKNLPAMQETRVRSLGREDPLEKRMTTHSSILGWRIPWTKEQGGPQSMGLQKTGHSWATNTQSSLGFRVTIRRCVMEQLLNKNQLPQLSICCHNYPYVSQLDCEQLEGQDFGLFNSLQHGVYPVNVAEWKLVRQL